MGQLTRSTAAAGPARLRHWMDREVGECAWPIGEGTELLSCCAPVTRLPSGRRAAYCKRHWRAMWKPRLAATPGVSRDGEGRR